MHCWRVVALFVLMLGVAPLTAGAAAQTDSASPPASPPDTVAESPGSLAAMLNVLPALPLGGERTPQVSYANIAAQVAAVGAPTPARLDDDPALEAWTPATFGLALPRDFGRMLQPAWREAFGFDLTQIDQSIEYALPPEGVTILRGRFDPVELRTTWEAGGYQPEAIEGGTVLSVRDDYEIDMDDPKSRLALANLNHVTMIDDQTLAYSSTRENLRLVLAVAAGQEASFADQVAVAPLLPAVPPDLVSALIVPGGALMGTVDPASMILAQTPGAADIGAIATDVSAQRAESAQLPPIAAALLGRTAGGPLPSSMTGSTATPGRVPDARLVIALTMINRAAAGAAVPVIEGRLATGREMERQRPYADLFADWQVRVAPEGPVVLIDLSLGETTSTGILIDLLFSRSLGFLAWAP